MKLAYHLARSLARLAPIWALLLIVAGIGETPDLVRAAAALAVGAALTVGAWQENRTARHRESVAAAIAQRKIDAAISAGRRTR